VLSVIETRTTTTN